MCGIYSCIGLPRDILAQALKITWIPHEGPSLNALSFLGYMKHWPNCCIDSYMPIDGSMMTIFCSSISLVWGQRVMAQLVVRVLESPLLGSCGPLFTADGPQSFKITGFESNLDPKPLFHSSDTSTVLLSVHASCVSFWFEKQMQVWGSRSSTYVASSK